MMITSAHAPHAGSCSTSAATATSATRAVASSAGCSGSRRAASATMPPAARPSTAQSPKLPGLLIGFSFRPPAAEDGAHGRGENCEVEAEPPGADVGQVEAQAAVEVALGALENLPQASDAGGRGQALGLPELVIAQPEGGRAGADPAHLAAPDIPDLRQLVEAGAAQQPPDAGNARIAADLEVGPGQLVQMLELFFERGGIDDHGAQLPHAEALAVLAHAGLAVEGRPGRLQAHGGGGERDQDRRGGAEQEAEGEIEGAFEAALGGRELALPAADHAAAAQAGGSTPARIDGRGLGGGRGAGLEGGHQACSIK